MSAKSHTLSDRCHDIPRCLSRSFSLESSYLCQSHVYGRRALVRCCASVAFCPGYRRNRESHGNDPCHRACLSPGFCRATSCGLLSGRGGRRSACRLVGHRSGREIGRGVCMSRGRAGGGLGYGKFGSSGALARVACGHAPLCCETDAWCRGRLGGRVHDGLRFCGMVSRPSLPPQVVVTLYQSGLSVLLLACLAMRLSVPCSGRGAVS